MRDEHINEVGQREFFASHKNYDERELAEKQLYYLYKIEKSNKRIQNNIVFFYYAFAVLVALSIVIAAMK